MLSRTALVLVALAALHAVHAAGAAADDGPARPARAELKNAAGETVGSAEFRQATTGVLLTLTLESAPAGTHALHLHETGVCEPPDFKSAGGHFAPAGLPHGFLAPGGAHAGDLPNVHVVETLTLEVFLDGVSLDATDAGSLLDEDGSALVLHEGRDDYRSQPAGDAGPPVACGVIAR